ncbi:MAG TPA: hypothetical protein VGP72_10825 [Planctomycetota bacterium]|jgi:hypothetical protein
MERNEDSSVGPVSDDFNKLNTRVDAASERRVVAHVGRGTAPGWGAAKFALVVGGLALAGIFGHKLGWFEPLKEYFAPLVQAPVPEESQPVKPLDDKKQAEAKAEISKENDIQKVAQANKTAGEDTNNVPPPPPPPPDTPPAEVITAQPDSGIIGEKVSIGPLHVQVENYWADRGTENTPSYAALSAYLINATGTELTMPAIEVYLLDQEKRQYKPAKQQPPTANIKVNPLIRTRTIWYFQLPSDANMYCAQFTYKPPKSKIENTAYVRLNGRTPENKQLVASAEYGPAMEDMMLTASPRAAIAVKFYKAASLLEEIGRDADDAETTLAKADKKLKAANKAADAAKTAAEKAKNDAKDIKQYQSDLEKNPPVFVHDRRKFDFEVGKAATATQRAEQTSLKAEDTLKQKLAEKAKLEKDFKDAETKLKNIMQKFDTQKKIVDDFKPKEQ